MSSRGYWFLMKQSVCAGVFSALMVASFASWAQDTDTRTAKLDELKAAIEELKNQLNSVKGNRSTVQKDLENSESKIGELNKKTKELEQQIKNNQTQLNQLQRDKEALTSVKKQQQRQVAEHVNTAYRLGQQSHLKMLLNQRDASLMTRHLKYFDYVVAARATQITNANQTLAELNRLEPAIQKEQATLARNNNSLREQQQALNAQQQERQRTLTKLNATIASADQKLKQQEKDKLRLQNLIERVVKVSGNLEAPVKSHNITLLKGQLPWPTSGRISHSFGSQLISGKMTWQGIMIDAPSDAPVKAIHHGRIVFSDYLRGHGLLIIIDHGQGMLSLYAHNKSLFKTLGEWVNAGEVIAGVGNSGGQSQTGLYFELRQNGQPTNPQSWLRKQA
ncbi:MAG: peptidoglycan DD-metalloendopeptidase family protein [Marinagarivorans sp.]|nr:peptidoglycan DD-metalloendopeptidase family protein [Marinagarivorans sp.]